MTVLITGGSRGIGAAIAERLAGQQHDLVLTARSKDDLRSTAERIRERYGVQVTAISVDMTKPDVTEKLKAEFEKKGITITGLVNNAGFGYQGLVSEMADRAESMITLNVTTLTELTRAFLPSIEQADGFVINIASVAGLVPIPKMSVYAATKAYVVQFSGSLALETKARVLCVCPGPVDTRFHEVAQSGDVGNGGKSAEQVAIATMHALKGRSVIFVSDPQLRWLLRLTGWMPRSWIRRLVKAMVRDRS